MAVFKSHNRLSTNRPTEKSFSLELEEDDILVSHDVVSLFTNTPVKESLDIISTRLEQVSDWQDTTMLEKDDILELLEFVLTTTHFAFRG